jgi:hypothetical protein
MIDPSTTAFDIDGVVADTMTLFLEIARQDYRVQGIRYEDMTRYSLEDCLDMDPTLIGTILGRIMDGDYTVPLHPFEGSGPVLARVATYRSPLLFVTARPHPGPMAEWMEMLVPVKPDTLQVVATGSFEAKAEVLLQRGIRFFVEDRLETCYQLKTVGIEPILYRQPWNREPHPFVEVDGWGDLEKLLAF